ncbi:MAG: vanadium-dependent haloperoxidase [Cyclobacteriaceae bacterium]
MMRITFVLLSMTLLLSCQSHHQQTMPDGAADIQEPLGNNNLAYRWGEIALEATARDTERFRPRPTITSRYLGLIFTAAFDAWTRYDAQATPLYLQDVERRPASEHLLKNKEIAISYAIYRAIGEYYYGDSTLYRDFMVSLNLNPNDQSLDPTTPEGIGNLAARAVIERRKNDGSNQYGDAEGSNGTPYFDYTSYQPVNSPDENTDNNRWQPKYFSDGKGGQYAPACLTPYWQLVEPLAMESSDQFRPGPPPLIGSSQLAAEVREVIELQASLTDEQKALVEFMRDGPQSVQQAGHWLSFALEVSVRDQHTLDEDVKMLFLNQAAAMDAFIAAWDSKMYYDFARPYALVHSYFQDQIIKAWGGPDRGMVEMKGQAWRPYSPETFLCPPFPSYVSGHSCISGACAEALRLFTGSDEFGSEVRLIPGAMTEPDHLGDTVTLHFPTFTETANMAGLSRVLGGYHIQSDNVEGLTLGRKVAHAVWEVYQAHVGPSTNTSVASRPD